MKTTRHERRAAAPVPLLRTARAEFKLDGLKSLHGWCNTQHFGRRFNRNRMPLASAATLHRPKRRGLSRTGSICRPHPRPQILAMCAVTLPKAKGEPEVIVCSRFAPVEHPRSLEQVKGRAATNPSIEIKEIKVVAVYRRLRRSIGTSAMSINLVSGPNTFPPCEATPRAPRNYTSYVSWA